MMFTQVLVPVVRKYMDSIDPTVLAQVENIFAKIPADIRVGPWAWSPTIMLVVLYQFVALMAPYALETYTPMVEAPSLRGIRLACFSFGAVGLALVIRQYGAWVMSSWTMWGWTIATLRFLAGSLGMMHVQRLLTFPSLFANFVTVSVWYCGLVPGMLAFAPKEERWHCFREWVLSLLLILIHGVNLPFSFLDWYLQPVRLELFDLWVGVVYSLTYLAFYLGFLDAAGVHFYFILAPRKWWASVVYGVILAMAVGVWSRMNDWEASLSLATVV